jgi:hypothetical protein
MQALELGFQSTISKSDCPMNRPRIHSLLLLILVIAAGLASRKCAAFLPHFLSAYAGDTLWALMVYLMLGVVRRTGSIARHAWIALAFSFAIEISQLYQADWINAIRHTTLGGLVLGFGFLWSDLLCYTVGVLLGVVLEWQWIRKLSAPTH